MRNQLPGLSSSLTTCCVRCAVRDAATTLKLGEGGGGKRLPGSKVTPNQNYIRPPRVWPTIFWDRPKVQVQKQNKI